MTDTYKIGIRLTDNLNPCHMGHQVGEEWLFSGKTPSGMCLAAYNALFPYIQVLQFGGNFAWQDDPDVMTLSCPDPEIVNRFELRRYPSSAHRAEQYEVVFRLTGKGKDGVCSAGHREGDEWQFGDVTPENICPAAYQIIYPAALVLQHGGQFPWQENPDVYTVKCPDPSVENRYEIRRKR